VLHRRSGTVAIPGLQRTTRAIKLVQIA